ncbi:ABC transporter substrate-binding protein [Actinomadura rudentiformis]|uniref:Extracellular solute-binding protein n=1 Tax=Actinomadura rudentiformis TaxID=359158 RepID=A0A6H9YTM9_9ACTN|nr:extracellular solute-binding protein [Actinomadura rudentiformis]KAB2348974.1 extracellular solute-binding protein [Actinomadura rudentiformis]
MRSNRFAVMRGTALATGLLLALAACSGDDSGDKGGDSGGQTLKGVKLEVAAVWTGAEGNGFKKVLEGFQKKTGATVTLTPTGDNTATFLQTKIQGGAPPDVAMLPQQGVIAEFAKKGWIKPLSPEVQTLVKQNYAKVWQDFGTADGKLYGLYFKAGNKSLVWYRTKAFQDAGVQPPADWASFVKAAQTLSDAGTTPLAIAGGDGWTLTDWFENVYASQAGVEKYRQLSKHEIKWTDPSVKQALKTLAEIWSKPTFMSGGVAGANSLLMDQAVTTVFGDQPKAAMLSGADVVSANITETKSKVGTDALVFPFPKTGEKPPLVGAGDAAVMLKDNKGSQEFMKYLASPEAAAQWAKVGGYISPNKGLDMSNYPDEVQRTSAKAVIDAGDDFLFDMSDLYPAAFGGTKGSGEWKRLQDFLKNPNSVDATAAGLESDAAKAMKS